VVVRPRHAGAASPGPAAAEAAAEPVIADAAAAGAESSEDISMEEVLGSKGRKAPASADDEASVESKTV
jgi:hypothetical protein